MATIPAIHLPRAAHWPLWLLAAVIVGLVTGFAVGLTRPHVKA